MENRQKLWLPRLLRSSLSSCRPRNLSDVVENSTFTPQTTSFRRLERPLPPRARLFPSICKSETPHRPRVSDKHFPLFYVSTERQAFCPPASPAFPLNPYYNESRSFRKDDKDLKKTAKKKIYRRRSKKRSQVGSDHLFSSSSQDGSSRFKSSGSWCWSSSDNDEDKKEEDDETDTLFSSRSFSSDSSVVFQHKNPTPRLKTPKTTPTKKPVSRRSKVETLEAPAAATAGEGGALPVKDSFAVVKKSSDPYEDFRVSMVEMIVERQIFAAADLEQLLQCFLLLNSRHHHRIIIEVFLEIYEALFST